MEQAIGGSLSMNPSSKKEMRSWYGKLKKDRNYLISFRKMSMDTKELRLLIWIY